MFQQIDNSNNYLFSLDRATKISEQYCLTKRMYQYIEADLEGIFKKTFIYRFSRANSQYIALVRLIIAKKLARYFFRIRYTDRGSW
jgi:hypothetical protein